MVFRIIRPFQAHIHHYTSVVGFEQSLLQTSAESLEDLISEYQTFERQTESRAALCLPRLQIAG